MAPVDSRGALRPCDQRRAAVSESLLSSGEEARGQYGAGGGGAGHAEDELRDADEAGGVSPDGEGNHRSAPRGHGPLASGLSEAQRLDCATGVPFHPGFEPA